VGPNDDNSQDSKLEHIGMDPPYEASFKRDFGRPVEFAHFPHGLTNHFPQEIAAKNMISPSDFQKLSLFKIG
jgi:hypothetical protein